MQIIDEPENRLERLLRLATDEPAHRPEFCEVLLQAPVFVLGSSEQAIEGEIELHAGSNLTIQHWEAENGVSFIPFFTSLTAMHEFIDTDESYLELSARSLFEITRGDTLVLNPYAEFSKDFLPDEIDSLLDHGTVLADTASFIAEDEELVIGQPGDYPVHLVDSLTLLFSKHDNVQAAYLALVQDSQEQNEPNLMIGIQGSGDLEKVIREAATVAWDVTEEDEIVDFIIIDESDDGLSDYLLNETKPFYEGSWGRKLKDTPESGHA